MNIQTYHGTIPSPVKDSIEKVLTIVEYDDGTTNKYNIIGALASTSIPNKENATCIRIGTNVTEIQNEAFSNCTKLLNVSIPNTVTHIRQSAFSNCSSLESIAIPDSVTSIGQYAFSNCTQLPTVVVPKYVTNIGNSAFANCTSIAAVIFKGNKPALGTNVFPSSCSLVVDKLTDWKNSVEIPGTFNGCQIKFTEKTRAIYEDSTSLKTTIEYDIVGELTKDSVPSSTEHGNLISIKISNNVTSLGLSAFSNYVDLKHIAIPNSITSIGNYAFNGCTEISQLIIPSGVSTIGDYAFCGCSNLSSIILGNTVASIGEYAFQDCGNLKELLIPDNVVSIGAHEFSHCDELMMTFLENFPKSQTALPEPGSKISVDYIFDDKNYGTRAAVESHIDEFDTIQTPWTILGYNKTIPQYVKYRCKTDYGFDYKYVSSIDDTSVDAMVNGVSTKLFIKHGWENANKIDENDCTGMLRPIAAGCKTYSRTAGGFAHTDTFTETEFAVQSVSEEIARNILANDGETHTYGNNNPYDCPETIVVDGKTYTFCGYTVTVQSTNLLTDKFNGTYTDTIVFDAEEDKYAVAVNKYEAGKTYYSRADLVFTAITPTVGAAIDEEEVYEYDSATKTMTCKSAYVQDFHEYGTELSGVAAEGTEHLAGTVPEVGTLITSDSLSVENNNYWDSSRSKYSNVQGCNKWCQSNVRTFMNFEDGKIEYAAAFMKKNPFDKNSTSGMIGGNSYMLKLAKDADFLKYVAPTVNRNAVPDKQYNTTGDNIKFRGSFVAYKEQEKASITGSKINVSHDVDKFFLISYTEVGFTTENANYDKLDATSDFTDVYFTGNNATSNETRKKYKYLASGELDASSAVWWYRSPFCNNPQNVAPITAEGGYTSNYASNSYRLSPACTLY